MSWDDALQDELVGAALQITLQAEVGHCLQDCVGWDSLCDGVREEHFGILQNLLIIGFLGEEPKVGEERD